MPALGRWSHIYHLDGRAQPNESVPHSDVFYSLNVLLGLSRVTAVPDWIDVKGTFERNAKRLNELPVRKYAFGTALWTAAELGFELPAGVSQTIGRILQSQEDWKAFHAQDLGMILAGVTAQARREPGTWSTIARKLFEFLIERYHSEAGLFFDTAHGPRRRFASFATQTYLTLASYCYGDLSGDERAIRIANACTRKLIGFQGPDGEWPWFFDAQTGRVLDYYEVYSVHQYGMAPAFLEWAERYGVGQARGALAKGFRWVLGQNQMSVPMILPELQLSIRSQLRKGELRTTAWRVLRAIRNSGLGFDGKLAAPESLELRRECRSYELGWILWSFGRRQDFPELTGHPMFASAKSEKQPGLAAIA
jgi:hypothetical protein